MNQQASKRIHKILASRYAKATYAGLLCFALAMLCITVAQYSRYASIWVANAVLLIIIFRSKPELTWLCYFAGILANWAANYLASGMLLLSFGIAISNSMEILLPILFVPRRPDKPYYIKGFSRPTTMLVISIPIGCLLAALLTASMQLDTLWSARFISIVFNWFAIDLLAMMAILPLGLTVTTDHCRKLMRPGKLLELIFVMFTAMALTWLSTVYTDIRFVIILMPLLYASFRLGIVGTSLICFSIVSVYIINIMFVIDMRPDFPNVLQWISYSFVLMCITLLPALIIAILIDQRDDFEDKLRQNEQRFRGAIQYSAVGMALVSPKGAWQIVNPALCEITGYTEEELMKLTFQDITYPDDLKLDLELMGQLSRREIPSYTMEKRYIKKSGEIAWISLVVSAVYNRKERVVYYITQVENITNRKRMEAELKLQATHDVLTGLINRREIELIIKSLLSDTRITHDVNSLFFIDLDNFKLVNDTAGHAAGDELLRHLSEILAKTVRKSDIVARLGGDEFAILLPNCSTTNATSIANNIINKIKNFHFLWEGKTYSVGASIGFTTFKASDMTLVEVMSRADIACYTAKHQGGNRVSIFEGMDSDASKLLTEIQMGPKVTKALHDNAFVLYAQKIMPLQNDKNNQAYFEILLRLPDENGNLILPSVFLKSAERHNIISDIDEWVIRKVLIDHASEIRACNPLVISINISTTSINKPAFHETLERYLKETTINTSMIGFELNEAAFSNDMESTLAFLHMIEQHGCFICIDNFGKGLRSFQFLKHFDDIHIKIDGDLIRGIDTNPVGYAIVDSVNQLAHKLHAKTVAQFVESEELIHATRKIGIDYAQGFAVSKPSAFTDIIKAHIARLD